MYPPCAWFSAQVFQPRRYRPGDVGNWSGHLPFAHDLIAAFRPSCFVELGTHLGESYFGFCQAIAENGAPCTAYAVDTWVGEEHAGFYDNTVYEEVLAYNQRNYSNFSYLLRTLFDNALENFADDSIDVLHIDGLHTFEAVSHDFYSWLPKVKPGGIVLLHDVCVRHLDFGVWKLWENLKAQGKTFEFHHSWGLGVFQKPGASEMQSSLAEALFDGGTEVHEQIRRYYSLAADELELKYRAEKRAVADEPHLQVYLPLNGGYEESKSQTIAVKPNQWQCISLDILEGVSVGTIRVDPADRPIIIEFLEVALISAVDRAPLWNCSGTDLAGLGLGGTLIAIGSTENNGAFRLFSYGNDPQVYLPPLETGKLDQPLTLKIWLRLQTELGILLPLMAKDTQPPSLSSDLADSLMAQVAGFHVQVNSLHIQIEDLKQELERERQVAMTFKTQLESSQLDHEHLVEEINKKQTRLYLLEDLRQELKQENADLLERFVSLEKIYLELRETFTSLETEHSELQKSHRNLSQKNQFLDTTLANVIQSRSWRLTAPLRSVTERARSRSNSSNSN